MPLVTLQVERTASGRRPHTVDAYTARAVSDSDGAILHRYYLDPLAQQRLRADREITPLGAVGVAVLVLMFVAIATYYSSNRPAHAAVGAVLVALSVVWVLFVRYRHERARYVLAVLGTYRRIGVFNVAVDSQDASMTHATDRVRGKIALLAPVPRLFRTARRLFCLRSGRSQADLTYLLSHDCKQSHPHLHRAVDDVVGRYVQAARYFYDQVLDAEPSNDDIRRACRAVDGEISDAMLQIERICDSYSAELTYEHEQESALHAE